VLNRPLRALIAERLPDPAAIQMHDWWAALVAAAFGTVRYDPMSSVLYRQHGGNTLGADVSLAAQTLKQAGLLIKNRRSYWRVHAQACEFLRLFGQQLQPADSAVVKALIESKASLIGRLHYAASAKIVRSSPIGAVAARGLIAAGWY
jgi:rhamnosyltransferase